MNKILVDPKLFITCRLCLSEMGSYQIDPSVQEQIKFCFDIDVHPFDSLPQLICEDCEGLLSNFHGKKTLFQTKQKSLRLKLQIDQQDNAAIPASKSIVKDIGFEPNFVNPEQTQQETVTSSQSNDNLIKERKSKPKSKKRIKEGPNTSTDKVSEKTSKEKNKREELEKIPKQLPNVLDSLGPDFVQRYTCKICNKHFETQLEIVNHCKNHDDLMSRHKKVFNKHCSVAMEKIDDSPNVTGSLTTVVINKCKILQNFKGYYFISYHAKDSDLIDFDDDQFRPRRKHKKIKPILDDSSDDDFSFSGSNKKRQRLLSKSSTDTVVLDENESKPTMRAEQGNDHKTVVDDKGESLITECINIDDSSDNDSNHSSKILVNKFNSQNKPIAMVSEYKTIQNIISICHGKYMKKLDSLENDANNTPKTKSSANFESLLKHKILSIGRKIINKQTFNCNGLLRFLDHKNLDIDWKPVKPSEENSHVKILTQMIELPKKTADDKNDKWKKTTHIITAPSEQLPEVSRSMQDSEVVNKSNKKRKTVKHTDNICNGSNSSSQAQHTIPLNVTDGAVLYLNPDSDTVKKKILNPNPVANPKKMPKKIVSAAQPSHQTASKNINETPLLVQERENESACMPIITFTTSLADTGKADAEALPTTSQPNEIVNPPPRIKVKPVSELMPDKVLTNVAQQFMGVPSSVWNTGHAEAVSVNTMPVLRKTVSNKSIQMPVRVIAATVPPPRSIESNILSSNDSECLVLNTVELPNTKTNCPFTYFKNLLQLHSLILYNSSASLSADFSCLIKFKVHFSNGNPSLSPVILSSSLMSDKNIFCMKIRDDNRKEINISALSAKWQWQLLQMFNGDVAEKLLENAAKISRETHYHSKIFISMLKSIKVLNYSDS